MNTALHLYTTLGCHLCEQAESLLAPVLPHINRLRRDAGLPPLYLQRVEIADECVLAERYGVRIPVLRVEGDSRELDWPFGQADIFNFLIPLPV